MFFLLCFVLKIQIRPYHVDKNKTWTVYNVALVQLFQVIRLNGGEYPNAAGMFNGLLQVTQEQWDALESMIRSVKGS